MSDDASTPDQGEMTYEWELAASPADVYAAVTSEAGVAAMTPPGTTAVEDVVVEPTPGGRLEAVFVLEGGGRYQNLQVFEELVANERIVYRGVGSGVVSTVTLADAGEGRTRVVLHQTEVPPGLRTDAAQAVVQATFEQLAAHLAGG